MPLDLPIIYPITNGATRTPEDILPLIEAAVSAKVPLFQIREKLLPGRVLYELVNRAVEITRGSDTRLLVNDRSDIARATGADGVHLTGQSLPADVMRKIYGPEFLIGVSTHSREEARIARVRGADFVVFGPVFATESKREFGEPQGLEKLREITSELRGFPVVAIGGITLDNVAACFEAGASGVAAIRLLNDAERISSIVEVIRSVYR
ncbi:MAG TPA: thiamine phosphate synthase [Pyrinomonadaceae bacterium]|nr:thiamine phosphate synthase [Pyrinomonadaceae bacterium]